MTDRKGIGGRPPILDNAEELELKVNEYFNPKTCPDTRAIVLKSFEEGQKGEYLDYVPHPTITGLAIHLGFASRQSIYDYAKKEDEFSYILKKAALRVENNYEKLLAEKGLATGAIFALKNMEWKDKHETDLTSKGEKLETNIAIVQDRVKAKEWGK